MNANHTNAGSAVMRRPAPMDLKVAPSVDIYETPDAFVITADMPGATKEGMEVTIEGDSLVIRASLAPRHPGTESMLAREIHHTGYERAFTLGGDIDRAGVDARFELGVLTLKLYKSDRAKPREIAIR